MAMNPQKMKTDTKPGDTTAAPRPMTQRQRWFKYGLNVAVLVLATLMIVILVNWIAYRRPLRADLTRSGIHSLSEQTLKVLNELDTSIRITTLYDDLTLGPETRQRINDLIAEYRTRSGNLTVQQIEPTREVEERRQFVEQVLSRYNDAAQAQQQQMKAAQETLGVAQTFAANQPQRLVEVMAAAEGARPEQLELLRQLSQLFQARDATLKQTAEALTKLLEESLPDYQRAKLQVSLILADLTSGLIQPAVNAFSRIIDDPQTPSAFKDALMGLRTEYQQMQARLNGTLEQLQAAEPGEYEELRRKLMQNNTIVLTTEAAPAPGNAATPSGGGGGGRGIVVLTLEDIYTTGSLESGNEGELTIERAYRGEEALTGGILQLTLKHNTKVVFVNPYPYSVLSPNQLGISYMLVAERLRAMNFEVTEWQPGGNVSQFGATPPGPRPVAEPGQTMVFVVLPPLPQDMQRMTMPTGPAIAQAVSEHLAAGQPAIFFTAPSAISRIMAQEDPTLAPLKAWGINVDSGRAIYTQVPGEAGQTVTIPQFHITDWPDEHPAARAVRGLNGVVAYVAQPILLPQQPPEGVQHWPLIRTPENTWADDSNTPEQATKDTSDPAGPLTIGVAAERADNRVVVIAEWVWATDRVAGIAAATPQGTRYQLYPANTELFVNSVYWLAGLDQLIAPSARLQDVERIEPISDGALTAISWGVLLVLPLSCLLAGGVVWVVRRR